MRCEVIVHCVSDCDKERLWTFRPHTSVLIEMYKVAKDSSNSNEVETGGLSNGTV